MVKCLQDEMGFGELELRSYCSTYLNLVSRSSFLRELHTLHLKGNRVIGRPAETSAL